MDDSTRTYSQQTDGLTDIYLAWENALDRNLAGKLQCIQKSTVPWLLNPILKSDTLTSVYMNLFYWAFHQFLFFRFVGSEPFWSAVATIAGL